MGNTTETTSFRRGDEAPARIGARLGAQRVELFAVVDHHHAVLRRRWSALGHDCSTGTEVPLGWFPWSLGNIRPVEYLFVRNAGPLVVGPDDTTTIADQGMSSALYLPIGSGTGAVCAYWSDELESWSPDGLTTIGEWASDALSSAI